MKSQNKCRLKRQIYHLSSGLAATTHNMILLKLVGRKAVFLKCFGIQESRFEVFWRIRWIFIRFG